MRLQWHEHILSTWIIYNLMVQCYCVDVPEYETSGGVNSCVDEVSGRERVWASPLMWMHALDLLLTKMRLNAVDFSRVFHFIHSFFTGLCRTTVEF